MPNEFENVGSMTLQALEDVGDFGGLKERELLTILFTDLVDSTDLQSRVGNERAARLVQIHRRLVRGKLEPYQAREIEWAGDSCLAVFTRPSEGVAFALQLQASTRRAREKEPDLPEVRIGLHLGTLLFGDLAIVNHSLKLFAGGRFAGSIMCALTLTSLPTWTTAV